MDVIVIMKIYQNNPCTKKNHFTSINKKNQNFRLFKFRPIRFRMVPPPTFNCYNTLHKKSTET